MRFNPAKVRLSLAAKFILLSGLLILMTSLTLSAFVIRKEINRIHQDLLDNGRSIAAMVAQGSEYGIYTEDQKALQQIVEGTKTNSDIVYVAIHNDNKRVLKERVNNSLIQIPATVLLKKFEQPDKIVYEEFVNKQDGYRYMDVIAPVVSLEQKDPSGVFLSDERASSPRVIGYVQLGLSQERLRKYVGQFLLSTVLFTSFLVLFGIALTIYITKKITLPIRALNMATQNISDGNFEHHVDIRTNDEISDLSMSFNTMLRYLRSYRAQVQENTSEVFDANRQMMEEISERKRAEKELVAAKVRLERLLASIRTEKEFSDAIFNCTASGIMVLDKEGHVLKINISGMEILQTDMLDVIGKKITDLYPESGAFLLLSSGLGREIDISLANNTSVPVGFISSPLFNPAEGREAIIVVFRNMAEIKRLQAELRKKEHFETMGKVISGVAHEVRNPLFGISSIGQILERELDSSQHKALIQAMLKETERMKRLVEELLLYTRPAQLDIKEIDLGILMVELSHYIKAKRDDLDISLNIPPLLTFRADRDKITQVFFNLLNNALDAAKSRLSISARNLDGKIEIKVADDGAGIRKEDFNRIFDPFFTTKKGGIGLGLSICKKIVEDHGGTIEVESAGEKGTAVILTFKG